MKYRRFVYVVSLTGDTVPNLAGASTILSVVEKVVYDEDEYKSSR